MNGLNREQRSLQGTLNISFIPKPKATQTPLMVRGVLLASIIQQVNNNTVSLRPPRLAGPTVTQIAKDGELVEDTNESVDLASVLEGTGWSDIWNEISKTTETVRIENPEDSEQYVDIVRRVASQFRSLTGDTVLMLFDNTDLET